MSRMADPFGTIAAVDEETCLAALATICRYATDSDEALKFTRMLGLTGLKKQPQKAPSGGALIYNPGSCIVCTTPMGSRKDPSWKGVLYGGRGRCQRCYRKFLRDRAKDGKAS